jgi:transcriptional regulator with XRE-family HTH domain
MSLAKQEQFLNKLSKRIADIRKAKGFTQERLAEEAEIDRVALANIETGRRRPTVITLYKLSSALKVDVKDFFVNL